MVYTYLPITVNLYTDIPIYLITLWAWGSVWLRVSKFFPRENRALSSWSRKERKMDPVVYVIPEVPYGSLGAVTTMFLAFLVLYFDKKRR
jgi:hypothetical protein